VPLDEFQQVGDSGRMHLDRQIMSVGVGHRHRRGGVAHAGPDLQHQRGPPREQRRRIERPVQVGDLQAVRRPEPRQRVALPVTHPAPARMEGADGGGVDRGGGGLVGGGHSDPSVRDHRRGSDVMCDRG
jgi:hypothetical protein